MKTRYDMLAEGFEKAGISAQRFTKWVREGRDEFQVADFSIRIGGGNTIDVSDLWAYKKWVGWTVIRTDGEGFVNQVILNKGKRVEEVVAAVSSELGKGATS